MGQSPQPPPSSSGGLEPNIAAVLAYFFWIPAVLWLILDPYKNDRFIRFHSFQALAFGITIFVLSIVLTILSFIIALIPGVNLILVVLWPLFGLAIFVVWILLMYKAFSKEMWKLPVIGDFCMKQAGGA